jgi:formylglycine-generating enzyme required for sulfatase activity
MEMIWYNPGTFMMGSLPNETGRVEDEIHRVSFSNGFLLGKFEVTQKEYEVVMGTNPSYFKGDTLPVEMTDWNDAVAFCKELNGLEDLPPGWSFHFPTEAQWEYACRGGDRQFLFLW